jgi:hypothetical protein
MLPIFKKKQRTPQDLADQVQRILSGNCRKWDVDSYENTNPKDPKLQDLHAMTMRFGLPETWAKLDGAEKAKLHGLIEEMKQMKSDSS